MKAALLIITFMAALFCTNCMAETAIADPSAVKTSWMTLEELNKTLAKLEEKENGKNFWDRGHWMNTVDGRWENGIPEYKISYSTVPENIGHSWYWWFNQSKESFQKNVHKMADEGFTLVYHQSFERPGEDVRYQGIWKKLKK